MDGEGHQHTGDEAGSDADNAALEAHINNLVKLDESRPLATEAKLAVSEIMPRVGEIKMEIEQALAAKDMEALAKKVQEASQELDNLRAYIQSLILADERYLELKDGVQTKDGVSLAYNTESISTITSNRDRCIGMLEEVQKVIDVVDRFKAMVKTAQSRQ